MAYPFILTRNLASASISKHLLEKVCKGPNANGYSKRYLGPRTVRRNRIDSREEGKYRHEFSRSAVKRFSSSIKFC